MKKSVSLLTLLILLVLCVNAQNPLADYKKAKKSFDKYEQSEDEAKLDEAYQQIQKAVNAIQSVSKNKDAIRIWMKAGEISNEIALGDYKKYLVNVNHKPTYPTASMTAYEAYLKVAKEADKKWDKSKAQNELLKTATFISNEGIVAYNIEAYEKAYQAFQTINHIKDFLDSQEHVSILNKKQEHNQHLLKTALATKSAEKDSEAIDLFEKLLDRKFHKPEIYVELSKLYLDSNKNAKALSIIKDGRVLFPDNEGLVASEINYYLNNDQIFKLTDKLEKAIQQCPENPSLYSTLGHVYHELYKLESLNNSELANEHFENSVQNFSKALAIDGQYSPALFNLGALYYNQASSLTKELNNTTSDGSAKSIRLQSAKQSKILELLDKALPYFQKAEAITPNDKTLLLALKELYLRKKETQIAQEFESRLAKVQAGGQNDKSYFGG